MAWMQDVTTEKLGPSFWNMHSIIFLGALAKKKLAGHVASLRIFFGLVESKMITLLTMYT